MIELRTLNLDKFDPKNDNHNYTLRKISNDSLSRGFVSTNFERFIAENNNDEIKDGITFVLKDKDEIVGLIGTKKMDERGFLELWCSIDSEYRGKGYATKSLEQITPYLIENVTGLNDIKLVIDRRNIISKKVAESVGYIKTSENKEQETYRYFGK